MKRSQQVFVCGEGWYYLLVLAFVVTAALLQNINLLMMVACMMLGPFVYNVRRVVVSLRQLQMRRKLPEGICAGDLLIVNIELANRRKQGSSWAIGVEDRLCRENGHQEETTARVLFGHLPPGETRGQTYQGRLNRRGRYTFGPVKVSTRFPLGLVRRTITFACPQKLTVYPRLGRLTDRWRRMHHEAPVGSRRSAARHGAMEGDFFALRDWRQGDSRRWVHWRTSARRGTLMVRQFEQQRNEDLLLLLDLWQPSTPSELQLERVEMAVSFAATAVADLCRRGGSQLHFGIAGAEQSLIDAVTSMGLLNDIMQQLAVVQAGPDNQFQQLLARGLDETPTAARVAIVSTRPIELSQAGGLVDLPERAAAKLAARQLICIDVGSQQLEEYFEMEEQEL